MRIIDLKDALRARDLATTGNKIELKRRLQEAIMQNHDLNTMVTELRGSRITNRECIMVRKEVTDGHETINDVETSDGDTAGKEK
ncbi:sap domain protein [Lasius niger]|uniref:Sap domain protein n=1 Tax=Lasius niger TaxID=67767 RepID=A0A0J7MU56_LASNI|nr:sap domain protein [Lasius niger]